MRRRQRAAVGRLAVGAAVLGAALHAQTPQPVERVMFTEAVARAVEKNPSSAIAAGVLRAEALLTGPGRPRGCRSTAPSRTTLNTGGVQDITVTPRNR